MKTLLILSLLLGGCMVNNNEIEAAQAFCKDHKGIHSIQSHGSQDWVIVRCNDKIKISGPI